MSPSLTVQEMVNAELQRDPDVSLTDLKWLAERVDPSVADLSDDEFRDTYAAGAGQGEKPKKAGRKAARKGKARRKSAAAAARKRPSAKAAAKTSAKPAGKKATAKKATAKKATAKKATAKKATAKKPAAKKATAKKAPRKPAGGKSKKSAKSPTPAASTAPDQDLTRARAAFLDFARDLTAAESRGDLVKVLADVDRYARRIMNDRG